MFSLTRPSSAAIAAKLQEAVALHNQGELLPAQRIYEEILSVEPRHFDALHLLGVVAAACGDAARAVDLIGRAIDLSPGSSMAHNNRGAALLELGLWEAALASFDRAIRLKEDYAEAHYNRGNALKELKRWEEALAGYERVLSLKAAHHQAHSNRGIVLAALGRYEASIASFDAAIALRPEFAQAHYNRANVLCAQRQWEAALAGYDRALALEPDYAEAHSNRGFVLHELRRLDESLATCERAIALKPDYVECYCNRGGALLAQRRVAEALSSYDRALEINPDYAPGRVNRALALLLAGDYERGWAENEWRWKDLSSWVIREKRDFHQPQWLGGVSPAGKTILLQSEQGYGDTIQFCRYAALVANLGARVILEVPRALAPLLESLKGPVRVVVQGEPLPNFDMFCPLLSLPFALRTTLSSIPAQVPYLSVGEERRGVWRDKLGERRRPRIGLVWSGGFRAARPELWSVNERRNIPLTKFAALGGIEADFYSLQKGEPAETEFAELTSRGWEGPKIESLTSELRDFADSAALIGQLDLVISVDTATAHLAGALAKPVWILNRFDACWRWLLERDDSPWYPTARLYRQERPGDWDSVMCKVARDLAGWLAQNSWH
ncbi:MAG: tetratricopeptide repeat protein [Steroidobacteraceae bacterium]|jgi:tetratricopeptide (TPR) repeat protein